MTYEVKTPLLLESIDAARSVIRGVRSGKLETREASVILGGARVLQAGVREDISARLAEPKIAAAEAKMIEAAPQAPQAPQITE